MFSIQDTIVAIATPIGRGGIGVVRVSGPAAHAIGRRLTGRERSFAPRHATLCAIGGVDQGIVTFFPAPASYTGDDVIEISAHGSPVVLRAIVRAAMAGGARLAERGEFTLRAFVNGRMDLPQAEAVADLIEAVTPLQARAAFDQLQGTLTQTIAGIDAALFDLIARLEASVDFPEEGYHFIDPASVAAAIEGIAVRTGALLRDAGRGRIVRDGRQIAIVGKPNVGKSSLFNALVGSARAIVTDVPGTTRDLVTETVDLEGLRVTLVDTAGLRETADAIESEGVARTRGAVAVADLVLVVSDQSREDGRVEGTIFGNTNIVHVANKADLPAAWTDDSIRVSATTGTGLDALRARIMAALDVGQVSDPPEITNARHIALVQTAHHALVRARDAAGASGGSMPEEFVLADLEQARAALEEVTGRRASDDLLEHIFSRFCVGK